MSVEISSPKLRGCVYVLAFMPPDTFPRLLGTAWAVESHSKQLLLTAYHCLDPGQTSFEVFNNNLHIMKSVQFNDDGTMTFEGVIKVTAIDGCSVSDVAVLRSALQLPETINLCPLLEFPSIDNEDTVKSYHVPCQSFPDPTPVAQAVPTEYVKISLQSQHHYFIRADHMHGSSGGVVIDRRGRAVGLICSGYVPGISLPLPDSIHTIWETISALSEGRGTYMRCVKFDVVGGLYEYCASH